MYRKDTYKSFLDSILKYSDLYILIFMQKRTADPRYLCKKKVSYLPIWINLVWISLVEILDWNYFGRLQQKGGLGSLYGFTSAHQITWLNSFIPFSKKQPCSIFKLSNLALKKKIRKFWGNGFLTHYILVNYWLVNLRIHWT